MLKICKKIITGENGNANQTLYVFKDISDLWEINGPNKKQYFGAKLPYIEILAIVQSHTVEYYSVATI